MKTLGLALLLISTAAYAMGMWQETSRTTEKADNQQEFIQLQQKYPDVFGGYDPTTVQSASITVTDFQYTGQSSCPAGDPRLTFESKASSICTVGGNGGPGFCVADSGSIPSDNDPCQ
jgi:hypothetical protein